MLGKNPRKIQKQNKTKNKEKKNIFYNLEYTQVKIVKKIKKNLI